MASSIHSTIQDLQELPLQNLQQNDASVNNQIFIQEKLNFLEQEAKLVKKTVDYLLEFKNYHFNQHLQQQLKAQDHHTSSMPSIEQEPNWKHLLNSNCAVIVRNRYNKLLGYNDKAKNFFSDMTYLDNIIINENIPSYMKTGLMFFMFLLLMNEEAEEWQRRFFNMLKLKSLIVVAEKTVVLANIVIHVEKCGLLWFEMTPIEGDVLYDDKVEFADFILEPTVTGVKIPLEKYEEACEMVDKFQQTILPRVIGLFFTRNFSDLQE